MSEAATNSALAIINPLEFGELSLDELAAIANREHGLVEHVLNEAGAHALLAGEVLNHAFALVPHGQWQDWLAKNFAGSEGTATLYRRMATYRDTLHEHNITSVHAAMRLLAEHKLFLERRGGPAQIPPSKIEEIRKLRRAGMTQRQIADVVGVHRITVQRYSSPGAEARLRARERRRKAREKMARTALQRVERDRAMARAGGTLAHAYGLVRELAAIVDRTRAASRGEVAQDLAEAMGAIYRVEDSIVRAGKRSAPLPLRSGR